MREHLPRPRWPYLQRHKTRHGKAVWYVRVHRGPLIRLRAEYGSDEFKAQYDAAIAGAPAPAAKDLVRGGSLRWLWDRYRETTAWAELSPATRRQRENIMDRVLVTAAHEPCNWVRKAHIEEGRDKRRDTPAQARNYLDVVRGLFRWAYEAKHIDIDPTEGVKNPKKKAVEGFKAWSMEDVARYEAKWPAGSKERVWMHVLLYTGCRRGDAVILGRQHVKGGVLTFTIEKGRDRRRMDVSRRIDPELAATLAKGPCGDLSFICGDRGAPLTKESFGNFFKAACVEAGLRDKSAHGLRKLSATIWAERGATEMELMAMFGWTTPQMAALYTRTAHRKTLSLNAQDRLARTGGEHSMVLPDEKVRPSGQN